MDETSEGIVVYGNIIVPNPLKTIPNAYVYISDGKVQKITHFGSKPDIICDVVLPGFIDPHVHCRDGSQSYKENILTASEAAAHGGITQIFDMPNTSPPIITPEDAEKRLELAKKSEPLTRYKLYIGLTPDKKQIKEAINLATTNSDVAGLKLYAGESVGDLAVPKENDQKNIYKALAKLDYRKVVAVHCEKESEMKPELWNPENPLSHCDARPQKAEIESIKDQIRFANEACFKGILHICHVTLPESVELIENARQSGLNITYGLTPHHLLIARENVKTTTLSLYYKANPPIRTAEKVSGLYKYLRKESFGWIESDHAPHKITEKLEPPYMSGMPNLDTYSNFICKINRDFDISWGHISALTSCNIAKAFGFETVGIEIGKPADLTCLSFEMETIKRKNLRTNCGWSPYEEFIFPGRTKATIVNGNIVYRGF